MIYIDNHATTPTDPKVCDVIDNAMRNVWGNPHSATHSMGWDANNLVEQSRLKIAKTIGAKSTDVIFTSGATEANNILIKGIALASKNVNVGTNPIISRTKILVSAIEHPCVMESAKYMQQHNVQVEFIPVLSTGCIDVDAFKTMLDDTVALVSVMMVNNELGTIQDIKAIAELSHSVGAVMHSDIAQAVGRIPVNMKELDLDAVSISAHKIYGPKGIGALVIRRGLNISPLFSGGGQEKGLRSGTLAPPLCIGFATACELATYGLNAEQDRLAQLRDTLQETLLINIKNSSVIGDIQNRVSGNLSLYVKGVESEDFFSKLKGVALSTGSACSSAKKGGSYVLRAVGIDASESAIILRICLGRFNSADDIENAGVEIIRVCNEILAN